ncbi:hypothetical protein AJ78_05280 [Emergomyces pasteurianus Ep9510]|uniref:Cytochrome b5 heme-binding domain-containing protein n=1 Tax=Emergomyces pasteurianus Ep9510 TaxID=1447872 RepID=A0A1J9QE18_9EURO|nr:hypothetical protein AJ78_05280 [Emergomyces pasteurianus Ep9510]
MGWIALGALVASVSFLLFKHPLRSWNIVLIRGWLRNTCATLNSSSQATAPPPQESPKTATVSVREVTKDGEHHTDTKPDDSTPKAMPVQPPLIDLPTFNLDESPTIVVERPNISLGSNSNASLSWNSSPLLATHTQHPPSPTIKNTTENNTLMRPPPLPTPKLQNQDAPNPKPRKTSMLPPPPPPRPSLTVPLRPPPSAASSLRAPSPRGLTSSTLAPIHVQGKLQPSRQVTLEPGHSPLDWAALTSNPNNKLRGENLPPTLIRVTPSMLKAHNGRKGRDAWTSYLGKVYNISPYLPFHPGGKGELLRGAGKNSEKLFAEVHPWVNWDGMLAECMVGLLVSEGYNVGGSDGDLEEMD